MAKVPGAGKIKSAAETLRAYTTGIRHLVHRPYTLKFPEQRYAVEKGYREDTYSTWKGAPAAEYVPGYARKNASPSYHEENGGIRSISMAAAASVTFAPITVQNMR